MRTDTVVDKRKGMETRKTKGKKKEIERNNRKIR